MRYLLIFLFFINITNAEDLSVYDVPLIKPGIAIGNKAPPLVNSKKTRSDQHYYVGLAFTDIDFKYSSLVVENKTFKNEFLSLNLGQKTFNEYKDYTGFFEFGGEWHRYKRTSGIYSQRLDLLVVNISQSIDVFKLEKFNSIVSTGLGASLVVGSLEQSVFSNSDLHLGGLGFFRADIVYLYKPDLEFVLGLKESLGSLGGTKLLITGLTLGLNFE